MKAKEIKRMASQSIKSRGVGLFFGTALFLLCETFFKQIDTYFENVSSIVLFLILIAIILLGRPLKYGFTAMYVNKRNGENVKFFDFIKCGFENFVKAWKITLRLIPKYIVPIICTVVSIVLLVVPLYKSIGTIKELWSEQPNTSEGFGTEVIILEEGIEYVEGDLIPIEMVEISENIQPSETVSKFSPDFIIGFVTNVLKTVLVEAATIIISLVLMLIACVFSTILSYQYRYCFTNAIMNPHLTSKEVVEKTSEVMSGNKFKSFGLDFSFILRFVLFSLISAWCIGFLGVAPQIIKLLIKSIISALCVMKYHMSHVVFFEERS